LTSKNDKVDIMKNRGRELRLDEEISQARLAAAMGVSRQTIDSIASGRYLPSLPLAMDLARYFNEPGPRLGGEVSAVIARFIFRPVAGSMRRSAIARLPLRAGPCD
jgi:putative transcriptional regulator